MTRILPLTAAAALALSLWVAADAAITSRLDQPAPEIVATTWWKGAAFKMESLRGKAIVLHVSDPARATSKAFLPNLTKLVEAYKDKPVVFIEIVENDDASVASDYVADLANAVKWQVGWDGSGAFERAYPGTSVPRTYLIGPDGYVVWHAHVMALTRAMLDAQVTRCAFADPKLVPEKARPAAKLMLELRFADAIAAADRVFTDKYADGDAKGFCAKIKLEVTRYYAFQKGLVDTNVKDLDWVSAYHRVERMLVVYKGTDHEAEVVALKAELNANPRVKYILAAQKRLDDLVEDLPRMSTKDMPKLVEKLKAFIELYPDSEPAKKAQEWVDECERRMGKKGAK